MASIIDPVLNVVDSLLAWLCFNLKQTTASYCDLETADSEFTLASKSGNLASIIEINGVKHLIGNPEFNQIHSGLCNTLQSSLKHGGHSFQVFFSYDREIVKQNIAKNISFASETMQRLSLDLEDLLQEKINYISKYCGQEKLFLVLWTNTKNLSNEQKKKSNKEKLKFLIKRKVPAIKNAQNIFASIPVLRNGHDSFVRSVCNSLDDLSIDANLLEVHDALYAVRNSIDAEFTSEKWRPVLPNDRIPVRDLKKSAGEISDVLWPSLSKQLLPRGAENLDLRTCQIGDKIYGSVFIELFPQQIQTFISLFNRIIATQIPWRVSFFVESGGIASLRFKSLIASVVSFASAGNRLLHDAFKALSHLDISSDEAIVKLQVSFATWADIGQKNLLRVRVSELAKAIESWGSCDVGEICGDPFEGVLSSSLAVNSSSVATISVAPLSEVLYLMPLVRPASPWKKGAILFRSPDGKLWPYQPGSNQQTTWIDIIYARPGSGKSVLSNSINLGLCLAPGINRLPLISIIDIGPSSSGLISLLKESLPENKKHLVDYHRLQMEEKYSINPFDTQLGYRKPTPQERSFLVNFLTLLATPITSTKAYDGIPDMVGLIIDELYDYFSDNNNARIYTAGLEVVIDAILEEINFVQDQRSTWWEVTDALFLAGFTYEAQLAQKYASPLLADTISICRNKSIEDLYAKITVITGENLIEAYSRMISSAIREYPILSSVTKFDLGDTRVVALDLDEVAKSGGEAADRQTAVMYMLARYILAKNYYLTEESLSQVRQQYKKYHHKRVKEIREDAKRIVYDEFHRTSKSDAVRNQVIIDMREGRKWNVQIALISQSLTDFDSVMIEFATSIFIMDAGPEQTVQKTKKIFGLSETATLALKNQVHGPRAGGATFLAQFATKNGSNTQVLTNTIGPMELWAFSTTTEDVTVRNALYSLIGSKNARRILAKLYPNGSVKKIIERRSEEIEQSGIIKENSANSIIQNLIKEILDAYHKIIIKDNRLSKK